MNKFITVDEKKTLGMHELDSDEEAEDRDDYLDYDMDTVTVTSRSLQNYGMYFEKELPLYKLAMMPRYSEFKKLGNEKRPAYPSLREELVEDRPLSLFLAQEIAKMSTNENDQHKQLVISNKFANVVRCQEKLLFWNAFDNVSKEQYSQNKYRGGQLFKVTMD